MRDMKRKLRVKGLIIDLEGTLIDTSYFYFKLLKDSAEITGIEFNYSFGEIQKIRDVVADGMELIEIIAEKQKEEYIETIKEIYQEYNYRYARPFPETLDVLNELIKSGFSLAIYSNIKWSWDEIVGRFPEFSGLRGRLNYLNRNSVEKPKPFPEGVYKCCKTFGVEPENCAVVGDSIDDIIMGKKAGCRTIGVLTGVTTAERLAKIGADVIIPRIGYLTDVLE